MQEKTTPKRINQKEIKVKKMGFIEVTRLNGRKVFINVDKIYAVDATDCNTAFVEYDSKGKLGFGVETLETYDNVRSKILNLGVLEE
jgi:hypothetical protein